MNGWYVAASAGYWGLFFALPITTLGALLLGPGLTSFVIWLLSLAGAAYGCWLRTARHWQPIKEIKDLRRKS